MSESTFKSFELEQKHDFNFFETTFLVRFEYFEGESLISKRIRLDQEWNGMDIRHVMLEQLDQKFYPRVLPSNFFNSSGTIECKMQNFISFLMMLIVFENFENFSKGSVYHLSKMSLQGTIVPGMVTLGALSLGS